MRGHRSRVWKRGGQWVGACPTCLQVGRDGEWITESWDKAVRMADQHFELSILYGTYASPATWFTIDSSRLKFGERP